MDNEDPMLVARLPDDTAIALSPNVFRVLEEKRAGARARDGKLLAFAEHAVEIFHRSHGVWIQKKELQRMLRQRPGVTYSDARFADMLGRHGWSILTYARIPDLKSAVVAVGEPSATESQDVAAAV